MPKPHATAPLTPFQRFTEFAKRVIAVPKAEIDEQAKLYRRHRKKRKKT
jgi:hypothetical protein